MFFILFIHCSYIFDNIWNIFFVNNICWNKGSSNQKLGYFDNCIHNQWDRLSGHGDLAKLNRSQLKKYILWQPEKSKWICYPLLGHQHSHQTHSVNPPQSEDPTKAYRSEIQGRTMISPNKRVRHLHHLDGVHFRCGNKNLGHPWTDLDETFRVYRVDLETMQRHIFGFRSRRENRKLGSPTIIPCNIFPEISDFSKTETFPNWF